MERMDKLKPCPFCGSLAELTGECDMVWVRCSNENCWCQMVTRFDEPEEAIEEWNRRAMAELNRLTCRDPEGRARLMPDVDLMAVIERLCQIEERGKGVLIMPRAEQQVRYTEALKRRWACRRSGNESQ